MAQQSNNLKEVEALIVRSFKSSGHPTIGCGTDEVLHETKEWKPLKVTKITSLATASTEVGEVDTGDLHEFKNEVAALSEEVIAIQADTGEYGERHVTTFILRESEKLSSKIINVEAKIIRQFPQREYSFHIRATPQDENEKFLLPSGSYYLMTWQSRS